MHFVTCVVTGGDVWISFILIAFWMQMILPTSKNKTKRNTSFYAELNSQSEKPIRTVRDEKQDKLYKMSSASNLVQAVAEKCGMGGERRPFIKILWPCFLPSEWSWLIGKSMKCCENCTSLLQTSHTKIQLFTWDEDCLWFICSLKTH